MAKEGKEQRIRFSLKELDAIGSAMGFALAGEFEETFGDDASFTREDAEAAHAKISRLHCAALARAEGQG